MRRNRTLSDSRDRARSAAATLAIHLALGAAFVTGLALQPERRVDESLKTFDVQPPPPPPPVEPAPGPAPRDDPAPAGKKADPSPIVAPPARLPSPQPVAAAPVAGTGSVSSAGAAASGRGTGAGGTGSGRGGGGSGGDGGIGTEARLISGNRGRVPRHLLRPFAADRGYAHLLLTIGESGRVTQCAIIQGTGSGAVDAALCQIMTGQSRWSPARDVSGRPISVQLRYTSTWTK